MMALSTMDPELSPSASETHSPIRLRNQETLDISSGGRITKQHGMSMIETPAAVTATAASLADAWRPLGRRLLSTSSSPPPTHPHSCSSSSSFESISPSENQRQDGTLSFGQVASNSGHEMTTKDRTHSEINKLKNAGHLRGVMSSCLSSSDSSSYDSSSSEDESEECRGEEKQQEQERHTYEMEKSAVPVPPPPVDPSYAESCLPVLSQLPRPPRSVSVDSGNGTRTGSLVHVKSPVLGNRKDAQTWQLQDEEFFMTSPRFGMSLGNRDTRQADLYCENSGGSLLSAEAGKRYDEEYQGHPKLTKDSRASSVDFTLVRSHEPSPPLPPPQEPLQRLRARSFSYSAAYGTSGYTPFNKQQYGLPFPHQQHLQQAQMAREFPPTLRCFHSGNGMMQPGQPQPPPTGVRPPRVSIPTDSLMHQYQYGPPMPYRRYSDAFAMPPYPDSHNGEQQENQLPQENMGRGIRSYSMEYGNYPSTRQARSQSMEGSQLFASAPPMEYPPSLSRSNSADVAFDWSRGHMDPAPPLPPDVRPVSGAVHFPPPPPEAYYDVEFKRGRREVFAGRAVYKSGEYVKVEADRGEDIGRVVQRTTDVCKVGSGKESGSSGDESTGRSKRHDLPTKKIVCVASQREIEMLNEQRKEEHEVFEVCKSKVRQRLLPMNVIDAEYQFDRHKLTFFFEADRRIDFRELVRDLFAIYKTRIWLQQVVPSGKKTGSDPEAN
ncbi:unnamed protein product [Peronospora belbahrii]|uniref:PSP1 C-terminal domain-containing protein n=1 Tax=Peronospora belbahrii TaxID=622444 RepID=A0ABN8D9I7_9STRA|nr:unnamed protein product [Peronospora belbahrii]